jgi:hypothetical protein
MLKPLAATGFTVFTVVFLLSALAPNPAFQQSFAAMSLAR